MGLKDLDIQLMYDYVAQISGIELRFIIFFKQYPKASSKKIQNYSNFPI